MLCGVNDAYTNPEGLSTQREFIQFAARGDSGGRLHSSTSVTQQYANNIELTLKVLNF